MKSKLETLRELIIERRRSAKTIVGLQSELDGGETDSSLAIGVAVVAFDLVLQDIAVVIKADAIDAGDDHGAALALVTAERDRLIAIGGEMGGRMAEIAAERDTLKEALAVSDAERHRLRGELEKAKYGSHQHRAALDLVTAERDTLKAALAKTQADADGRFLSQAATIDRVRKTRDRYDAECNDLRAALASVEGERDSFRAEIDKAGSALDQWLHDETTPVAERCAELSWRYESRGRALDIARRHNGRLAHPGGDAGWGEVLTERDKYRDLLERISRGDISTFILADIKEALA